MLDVGVHIAIMDIGVQAWKITLVVSIDGQLSIQHAAGTVAHQYTCMADRTTIAILFLLRPMGSSEYISLHLTVGTCRAARSSRNRRDA